ncbi:MAG: hypothetical protein EZS28_031090 [Streblomastix strix]|uniref:Uncharacterized protein n=1 Tax=Streblomastix strix TaxID=222440 RepID=A0A5J4USP3_9EUKA|nr:MAG: hypothetical protein EZS28_031090 [Streblomastix strix]
MSQTERHKPYPDPIFYAMKELKITDPKRVLFVGDAQTDIQSGLSANIFTALVPHSMSKQKLTSKPHYMLNSFDDVLSLCYGRGIEIAKDEDLMKEKQKKKQKKDQDQEVEEEEE